MMGVGVMNGGIDSSNYSLLRFCGFYFGCMSRTQVGSGIARDWRAGDALVLPISGFLFYGAVRCRWDYLREGFGYCF